MYDDGGHILIPEGGHYGTLWVNREQLAYLEDRVRRLRIVFDGVGLCGDPNLIRSIGFVGHKHERVSPPDRA